MTDVLVFAAVLACIVLAARLVRVHDQMRRYRRAFEVLTAQAPVGILQADADGLCVFANDAWYAISGLAPAETLGHQWSRAVHPDDLPSVMAKWEASVRSGEPYMNEVRVIRPDGGQRTVLCGAAAIHGEAGHITGFIGTVLDITSHRDAEQEARRTDALLQSFVDNSPAAIYVKDAAGRYLLMNRRHVELWPATRDLPAGTTPFDFLPEEVARSFLETDRLVFESGQQQTFEETLPQEDGLHEYVTVKFPVFDGVGRPFAVGGMSTDVTELVAARRALAVRERLLSAVIDVQEAERQTLCHEFHDGLIQYVVGAKMLLEQLRDTTCDPHPCDTLDTVISYLTKGLEDGRRVIRGIRPAVLDDLGLHAALDDISTELRGTGIAVDVCIEPTVDCVPVGLQTTAYRIVQEALANARKHSGTDRVTLHASIAEPCLVLEVEDVGCGFDPAAVGTIDALDRSGGLGLVGMRERARLAGGTCMIDSRPGHGTRIRATLPLPVADADAGLSAKSGEGVTAPPASTPS
jgi:PAS domain S-box-containing protein